MERKYGIFRVLDAAQDLTEACRIFGVLPLEVHPVDLRRAFEKFGVVLDIEMTPASSGHAQNIFVAMLRASEARLAIRNLRVNGLVYRSVAHEQEMHWCRAEVEFRDAWMKTRLIANNLRPDDATMRRNCFVCAYGWHFRDGVSEGNIRQLMEAFDVIKSVKFSGQKAPVAIIEFSSVAGALAAQRALNLRQVELSLRSGTSSKPFRLIVEFTQKTLRALMEEIQPRIQGTAVQLTGWPLQMSDAAIEAFIESRVPNGRVIYCAIHDGDRKKLAYVLMDSPQSARQLAAGVDGHRFVQTTSSTSSAADQQRASEPGNDIRIVAQFKNEIDFFDKKRYL